MIQTGLLSTERFAASEIDQQEIFRIGSAQLRRVDGLLESVEGLEPIRELPDFFSGDLRPVWPEDDIVVQHIGSGALFRLSNMTEVSRYESPPKPEDE
jgi:hypothetical protein